MISLAERKHIELKQITWCHYLFDGLSGVKVFVTDRLSKSLKAVIVILRSGEKKIKLDQIRGCCYLIVVSVREKSRASGNGLV